MGHDVGHDEEHGGEQHDVGHDEEQHDGEQHDEEQHDVEQHDVGHDVGHDVEHDVEQHDEVRDHDGRDRDGEGWVHGDLLMKYEQVAHFQFGRMKKKRFQQPLK